MTSIEPIITLALDPSYAAHIDSITGTADPSWVIGVYHLFGVAPVTIDGQIVPGAILIFYFAAWGAYHWALMARDAIPQIPVLVTKYFRRKKL